MREVSGNAWDVEFDVLCITTNCTIADNGRAVMGGGIAGEAAKMNAYLSRDYARLIRQHGHHVYLINDMLMFPTKNEVWESASIDRIIASIFETHILADLYGWDNILLPRPGSGLGGLDWHTEVKPEIALFLDDRFIVVSYPGEK